MRIVVSRKALFIAQVSHFSQARRFHSEANLLQSRDGIHCLPNAQKRFVPEPADGSRNGPSLIAIQREALLVREGNLQTVNDRTEPIAERATAEQLRQSGLQVLHFNVGSNKVVIPECGSCAVYALCGLA